MLHMTKNNFSHLLTKAQDGDHASYALFLKECHIHLDRRLTKWIRRPEVREEIIQEILLGIHRNLASFHPDRNAEAWIAGITRYKLIDYFRKNPHKFQILDFDVTNLDDSSNEHIMIDDVFSSLPDLLKEAILMTKVQGLSTKEAALKLGVKENAIRTRISRALTKLREELKT